MNQFIKNQQLYKKIERLDEESSIEKKVVSLKMPGTLYKELDKRCNLALQSKNKALNYMILGYLDTYFTDLLGLQFDVRALLHDKTYTDINLCGIQEVDNSDFSEIESSDSIETDN